MGLALAAVPLAAPGPDLVPAAQAHGPRWLLGLYGNGLGVGPGAYYAFLWLAFAAHLCVLLAAPVLDRRLLRGASVLLIAAFALAPPLLSQDVFSYIDYARLGVLGDLNPYSHDPPALPGDPAFPFVGWADSPSAYGPLFTLFTYPLAALSVPAALWTLKGIAAASVLALALLVARVAPSRGVDPRRGFVMVALNPLVLVHVVGGAHNDATTMLVAFVGCAAVLTAREASGGFALASAAALKASAAFVAPFALLASLQPPTGRKVASRATNRPIGGVWRWLSGAALALLAIGLAAYAAFGWEWLDGFGVVGENQGRVSNYSLPNLLSELLDVDVAAVRTLTAIAYLALFAALLRWVHRGGDWIRATGWAALGLLLATAWLLPWYIVWALPFAAISRDERLVAAVLALTALQLAARV
ncbi:MAG TPA: polyprenol phosphomannose-dependent alpha 1,6 mannosyltransferase MptB, partial [Solirubrobacterales bacterium]|nr:polyprenol phosphomannose-dependent alpha 1,6 mannosyltransferase MptB [Solirubrobacterales bacterium]